MARAVVRDLAKDVEYALGVLGTPFSPGMLWIIATALAPVAHGLLQKMLLFHFLVAHLVRQCTSNP